ncbi:hypothetical protein [Campylobacter sp. MIT 99-7217]|uniref:hypothetical protein n=1 Tax=Campylobacter sp. MIT 99-7217 TaxID=535091 RepID=UPI00115AD40C|nr:hypothetical protein [Campylobacter sp. MIT 99-7217]
MFEAATANALMGVGSVLAGGAATLGALDSVFGSGKQNIKLAKDNLNLAKDQFKEEKKRYDTNQANLQANSDMIGSVFDDSSSVWNRI